MRKIILTVCILFLTHLCAFGIEEVIYPDENIKLDNKTESFEFFKAKSKTFENSFLNKVSGEIRFKGTTAFEEFEGSKNAAYPFEIDSVIDARFSDNKYRFHAAYSFTKDLPEDVDSQFFGKFANLFIERELNKNNKLRFGTSKAPIGYEGSMSSFYLPFAKRAQISRTIGNATATGVSIIGSKDFIEYNLGGYTSTRYTQGFKDGADFIGRIGFIPFYNKNEGIKNLKFYLSSDIGHKSKDYQAYSGAMIYEYKKFLFNAEYAYANGYNGRYESSNNAEGYFITTSWNLTPKVQLLLRYDYFNRDKNIKNDETIEYTAGINWFIFKERLKFALNYVFCDNKHTKDKHGIYFLTQLFI